MVSKKYQPLEDARTKALEEARLRREARTSRYGGKYNVLKDTHSRAVTDRKAPEKTEGRDEQSRGSNNQAQRSIPPIAERNEQMRWDNYVKNKTYQERVKSEKEHSDRINAESLEYMKKNHPDEYSRQMKDKKTNENWEREDKWAKQKADERRLEERNQKPENKWSRELSDKGRQTSDQARSKGREGREPDGRDGHDRTGR